MSEKMTVYDELVARGLIAQVTDEKEIKEMINEGKAVFYIGFDPTADSLHVGHFILFRKKIKILPFVFRQVKELFPNAKLFMTSTCSYRLKWILRQMGLTAITARLTCPLQFLPTQPKKFPSCAVSVT